MDAEQNIELAFPTAGVNISTGYDKQPAQTTPLGRNVRGFETLTNRARGGSRPGLSKYVASRVNGAHLIQHLGLVVSIESGALLDDSDWPDGVEDTAGKRGRLIRRGGSGRQQSRSTKKTPRIIWVTPADIDDTTALDATQLNAHIQDPADTDNPAERYNSTAGYDFLDGTFTYKLADGTVAGSGSISGGVYNGASGTGVTLHAGLHQPLLVTFTPTELTNTWRPVKKTVFINVTHAAGGGGAGTGTMQVTAVNPPLDCTLANITINGDPLGGGTFDYHAMGFPAGLHPRIGSTYSCQANPDGGGGWDLATLIFTSFSPSDPE